jgi:hypothetical protein
VEGEIFISGSDRYLMGASAEDSEWLDSLGVNLGGKVYAKNKRQVVKGRLGKP